MTGDINPIDANAPKVKFQLNLPTNWNNKIMMFGGGYDGAIPSPAGNVPAGPIGELTPRGRGNATFSSDSGHQAVTMEDRDGSFGINDEAVKNQSRSLGCGEPAAIFSCCRSAVGHLLRISHEQIIPAKQFEQGSGSHPHFLDHQDCRDDAR